MTVGACQKKKIAGNFKSCSICQNQWETLESFLEDPAIKLVGYMPTFDDLQNGLFLFNHTCGTTLACQVGLFTNLYDGPVYTVKKTGQSDCPGHCLNKTDFSPCPVVCNCAHVRDTLQIIKTWPKNEGQIQAT